jgi:hypothetical protein
LSPLLVSEKNASDRTSGLLCGETALANNSSGRLPRQDYSDEPPSSRTSASRRIRLYAVGIVAEGKVRRAHIDGESTCARDAVQLSDVSDAPRS